MSETDPKLCLCYILQHQLTPVHHNPVEIEKLAFLLKTILDIFADHHQVNSSLYNSFIGSNTQHINLRYKGYKIEKCKVCYASDYLKKKST